MRKSTILLVAPALLMTVLASCKSNATKKKVTFELNYSGSAAATTIDVELNKKVSEPTAPTRDGYGFAGWFTEPECKTVYNFENPVTTDFTLYAGWSINDFSYELSETNTSIDVGDQKTLVITLSDKNLLNDLDITWTNNDPEHIEEVSVSSDKLSYTFKGKAVTDEMTVLDSIKVKVQAKHGGTSKVKECSVNVRKAFDGTVSEEEWKAAIDSITSNEIDTRNFTCVNKFNDEICATLVQDGVNGEFIPADTLKSNYMEHEYETKENGVYLGIQKINNRDVIESIKKKSLTDSYLSNVAYLKEGFKAFNFDKTSLEYVYDDSEIKTKVKFNKDRKLEIYYCYYKDGDQTEIDTFTYGAGKVELPKVDNKSVLAKDESKQKLVTDSIVFEFSNESGMIGGFTTLDLSKITDMDFTKDVKITLLDSKGETTDKIKNCKWAIDNKVQNEIAAENGEIRISANVLSKAANVSLLIDAGQKSGEYNNNYKICVEYNVPEIPAHIKFLKYTLSGNEVSVAADGSKSASFPATLTIPETIDGKYCGGNEGTEYPITKVASYGFQYISKVNTIVLPSSIKEIGGGAFNCCTGLSSINLQNTSITEISFNAFNSCSSLKTVTLPSTVKKIQSYGFSNMETINIPTAMEYISGSAFGGASTLKSATFEDTTSPWSIIDANKYYEEFIPSSDPAENASKILSAFGGNGELYKNIATNLTGDSGNKKFTATVSNTTQPRPYEFNGSYTSTYAGINSITVTDENGNNALYDTNNKKTTYSKASLSINGTNFPLTYNPQTGKLDFNSSEATEGPIVFKLFTKYYFSAKTLNVEIV